MISRYVESNIYVRKDVNCLRFEMRQTLILAAEEDNRIKTDTPHSYMLVTASASS